MRTTFPSCLPTPGALLERFTATLLVRTRCGGRSYADAAALVIFQGPDSFISPSWYPSKRENARVVPTWNYAVVHVHGVLRFVDDPAWVRSHVEALTHEHEAKRDPPWAVTDAPADFVEKMVAAVVGIEISITQLVGKWKVSQNRSISDRVGVVEALEREAHAVGGDNRRVDKGDTGRRRLNDHRRDERCSKM